MRLWQARHTENVPKVEPFAIPIQNAETETRFRGVTKATHCYQSRVWVKGASKTLETGSPDRACIPRLACVWAKWQLANNPHKYKKHFDEEWLRLWMDQLADINCTTTSEDIIKFWGGEAAQVW